MNNRFSADACSLFRENGIFDPATGLHFMREILELGAPEYLMP